MAGNDDAFVLLVADLHNEAAEALARRERAEELMARARQLRSDFLALQKTFLTDSLAQVRQTKPPLYVRRWPGVDRRA